MKKSLKRIENSILELYEKKTGKSTTFKKPRHFNDLKSKGYYNKYSSNTSFYQEFS
jgi:hypothetical protein